MSSEAVPQPNVVSRVVSLPLVSSTYGIVSSAYISTKETHPYLRSLCEVAETGVLTFTAVAMTSAEPIIQKMERQIAVANNYACMGLDKIEAQLPILNQPSDKIVSRASDIVIGAKDAFTTTVTNAKELVVRTKEAVNESVAMTKAAVNGSINTVLESHVVHIVNEGVDTALTKSESLIDQYLPLTEEELAREAGNIEGFDVGGQKPNYYVRLGSLSSKVRTRAFQQAVDRLRDLKSKSYDVISQLHATIDVMQFTRKNQNSANQKLQEAQEKLYQSWLEWRKSTGQEGECASTEDVESRTLAIARNLTKNLQTTCVTFVSNLHGLPHNLHEQAHHMSTMAAELYQNFHLVSSFREVSDNLLGSTKGQLDRIKGSLDHMVDYVVHYTPLNWLVGPFYPQLVGSPAEPEGDEEMCTM